MATEQNVKCRNVCTGVSVEWVGYEWGGGRRQCERKVCVVSACVSHVFGNSIIRAPLLSAEALNVTLALSLFALDGKFKNETNKKHNRTYANISTESTAMVMVVMVVWCGVTWATGHGPWS